MTEHTSPDASPTSTTEDMTPHNDYNVTIAPRERTPDMAVQTFDGDFIYANGKQVQTAKCTRPIFNFAVLTAVILSALIASFIMLGVMGFNAPGTDWLKAIIAFCIGVFVPNPQIQKDTKTNTPPGSQSVVV